MYEISTEDRHALVSYTLVGEIDPSEMRGLVEELRWILLRHAPRPIAMLADLRGLQPFSAGVARQLSRLLQLAARSGVQRLAEIVTHEALASQLELVAKVTASAIERRRFADVRSARRWLLGDPPPDGG